MKNICTCKVVVFSLNFFSLIVIKCFVFIHKFSFFLLVSSQKRSHKYSVVLNCERYIFDFAILNHTLKSLLSPAYCRCLGTEDVIGELGGKNEKIS